MVCSVLSLCCLILFPSYISFALQSSLISPKGSSRTEKCTGCCCCSSFRDVPRRRSYLLFRYFPPFAASQAWFKLDHETADSISIQVRRRSGGKTQRCLMTKLAQPKQRLTTA